MGKSAVSRIRQWAIAIALVSLTTTTSNAGQFEESDFTVLSGYINGDSYPDILLVSKSTIVMIAGEIVIPIVIRPPVPTFAIMSQPDSSYYLDTDPSESLINDSGWSEGTHEIIMGDVLGNGEDELLVRAMEPDSASFLISVNMADGALTMLQDLSPANIGVDLGADGTTIELRDADGDGRVDLHIRVDGVIKYIVLADDNGTFVFPEDDQGSIQMAWNTFCFALNDGDIPSAISQIQAGAHTKYIPALEALGENVQNLTAAWSDIKELRTTNDFAEYTVFETIDGEQRMHIIMFIVEDGVWKLAEF